MTTMLRSLLVPGLLLATLAVAPNAGGGTPPPQYSPHGTLSGPTPVNYPVEDDPAGDPCPFPIHTTFPVNKVVEYDYKNARGRLQTAFYRGALYATITRTDTGASVTKNLSASGVQRFATDGSSTLYGVGPYSATLHPGDSPGPELALISGASALRIGADGRKTILYASRVQNICTELA